MRTAILVFALTLCATVAFADDYVYEIDFEDVPLGKVEPEADIASPGAQKDVHLGLFGAKEFDENAYGEIVDGAGAKGSRGLSVVDRSAEKMVYTLFYARQGSKWAGPIISTGVVRLDICFDELPTTTCFIGRRNCGLNIRPGGKGLAPGGIDAPKGGQTVQAFKADFRFEKGKWYRIWIQFDPDAVKEKKLGLFSVLVKPFDGTDEFKAEHAVVTNATYRFNMHDAWGRIAYPPGEPKQGKVSVRVDNFMIRQGKVKWVDIPVEKDDLE